MVYPPSGNYQSNAIFVTPSVFSQEVIWRKGEEGKGRKEFPIRPGFSRSITLLYIYIYACVSMFSKLLAISDESTTNEWNANPERYPLQTRSFEYR